MAVRKGPHSKMATKLPEVIETWLTTGTEPRMELSIDAKLAFRKGPHSKLESSIMAAMEVTDPRLESSITEVMEVIEATTDPRLGLSITEVLEVIMDTKLASSMVVKKRSP